MFYPAYNIGLELAEILTILAKGCNQLLDASF